MATRKITIHAGDVTVGDVVVLDDGPHPVETIRHDAMHNAVILDLGDGRDIRAKRDEQIEVETPRPHRYGLMSVTTPSSGTTQIHTIVDLYHGSVLTLDDQGETRATPSRPMAMLWCDVLNLAHHLGVEL